MLIKRSDFATKHEGRMWPLTRQRVPEPSSHGLSRQRPALGPLIAPSGISIPDEAPLLSQIRHIDTESATTMGRRGRKGQ